GVAWATCAKKKKEVVPQGKACREDMQLLLGIWPDVAWDGHVTKYEAAIDGHKKTVDTAKDIMNKQNVGSYLYWGGIVMGADQFANKFKHSHEGVEGVVEIAIPKGLDGTAEKTFVFQDPQQPYRDIRFFSQCDVSKTAATLPSEKHVLEKQAQASFDKQVKLDVGARAQQFRGDQFATLPKIDQIQANCDKVKADAEEKKKRGMDEVRKWENR
ncbi:unnamed protein product, partial [Prorocentrum cordatum]